MNQDYHLTRFKLQLASDSIRVLNKIVLAQDSLTIDYRNLVRQKDTIILIKDRVRIQQDLKIDELKTNIEVLREQRDRAIVGGVLGMLITIVLSAVF